MVGDMLSSNRMDKDIERFARMGIHLAKYRYTSESDWLQRTKHLYRAAAANPRAVFDRDFPKRELFIGREPLWKFLSVVKRALGFSPRTSTSKKYSVKQKLGALIYDFPRYAKLMWMSNGENGASPWVLIRNREDRLATEPTSSGVRCNWEYTSDLHIANVFPILGHQLLRRAFIDHPVVFQTELESSKGNPEITFIVGHRGLDRLPQLLATLQTICGQRDVAVECIVVEQSATPEIKDFLPKWVRYAHVPLPDAAAPYCRGRAFNVGASLAHANMLVLHDNDLLIPSDYAAEIKKRFREEFEVINVKRFIFYLSSSHTKHVTLRRMLDLSQAPESIMQNALGGGSLAVSREAYFSLGGFDESFVGWGGEDNEFWERAQTRKVWSYGYMPLIHLWHESQPEKYDLNRSTVDLLESRSAVPAEQRIEELRQHNFEQAKTEEWHRLQSVTAR